MSNSSSNASENPVYALFHTDEFTLDHFVGGTPLVRLKRLNKSPVTVLAKLEGNNPAGSPAAGCFPHGGPCRWGLPPAGA